MLKVNHKELNALIKTYYEHKISLLIYGRFGIGKSFVVSDTAKEIAGQKNRKFVNWNKLTEKEKDEIIDNPKEFFVLIDCRLSEYSPDDIKGLPVFKDDKKSIEWKVPFWALLLEKKDSDGIVFFDEIGLAPPLVQSSVYKIIYDRYINESKINDFWGIIGASNLQEDRAYIHDLASPLKDRAGEVELTGASVEDWTDWGLKNKIESRIIGFLNFKSSNLWKVDYDDNQKYTTYRGWGERVNRLIKSIKDDDYSKLLLVCSSAIGEGVASEFVAFCKLQDKVKIQEIIKHPEKLKELDKEKDLGIKYFIITALADCYRDNKAKFKDIMSITEVLDELNNPEFVALLWRLCLAYKPEFENEFVKGDTIKIASKYLRYLR